jgi:hypothetical protein
VSTAICVGGGNLGVGATGDDLRVGDDGDDLRCGGRQQRALEVAAATCSGRQPYRQNRVFNDEGYSTGGSGIFSVNNLQLQG